MALTGGGPGDDPDAALRVAAFQQLQHLRTLFAGALPWSAIKAGFPSNGRTMQMATEAEGIFKPREMSGLLSLKTVIPKPAGRIWYADQMAADPMIPFSNEILRYSFSGSNPNRTRNQWLRDAMVRHLPLIYFYGVAPGVYEPLFPVYVVDWNPSDLCVSLAMSLAPEQSSPAWTAPEPAERRYAMRLAKQRLHQSMFRQQVVDAYGRRCAFTKLPEVRLLDAAHIVPDSDDALGQPDVRNGILMSRIHHGAYDAGLISIDADYRVHVASSLLGMNDGPLLEGLKGLQGATINVPKDPRFRPDRERLALRFESFERSR